MLSYSEKDIDASIIEQIVQNITQTPRLGLALEDVNVVNLTTGLADSIKPQPPIDVSEVEDNGLEYMRVKANHLSNLNVLIQEYPELSPRILSNFSTREMKLLNSQISTAQEKIREYVEKQKNSGSEIDPRELGDILRNAISKDIP